MAVLDAPLTCLNFMTLARAGFFKGSTWHRVVPNFVAQDGDPRGDGEGGPGYTIRDEINERPYLRGTMGMALDWADTGGSQFFLTHSPQPHLDGRYTVFGRIVAGLDVLDRIQPGDTILRVRVWDGKTMSGAASREPLQGLSERSESKVDKKGGDARPLFLRQSSLPLLPGLLGGLLRNFLRHVVIPPFISGVCVSSRSRSGAHPTRMRPRGSRSASSLAPRARHSGIGRRRRVVLFAVCPPGDLRFSYQDIRRGITRRGLSPPRSYCM